MFGGTEEGGHQMARYLIVASREQPELWGELVQRHGADPEVEIILDRREHPRHDALHHPPFRGSVIKGQFLAVTRW